MADPLHTQEIQLRLKELKSWNYQNEALQKSFKFKNFAEAWAFMSHVALLAEKADHHPDWSNVYNKVEINLTTHEAGGVSEKDFELAALIDAL